MIEKYDVASDQWIVMREKDLVKLKGLPDKIRPVIGIKGEET